MTDSRVGVFGGTFDPIHIGHLIIAEEVRCRLNLECVLFVPARISPHKLAEEPCPVEQRYEMVRRAVADNARFGVSRVDLDRPGPSYTVDTLEILSRQLGRPALYFILGTDSLASLYRWREPERIVHLSRIVAVARPGFRVDVHELDARLPGLDENLEVVSTLQLDISSTSLRERIRQGWPIRYQVPAAVEDYIVEHGLYAALQSRCPKPAPPCL